MREQRAGAAIVLGLAVALLGACGGTNGSPGPSPQPSEPAGGNALQPLVRGLTWTYRNANPGQDPNALDPLVTAVVGTEDVAGEQAWLLEYAIGTTFPSRLVAVDRGGEVWVVAIDGLVDGAWKRSTLPAAQLYQPRPGERSWVADFTAGPEAWKFKAAWQQRASGTSAWAGVDHPAWLLEGDLTFDGSTVREIDTVIEGVGISSILDVAEGGGTRFNLDSFGTTSPPLAGHWRGTADGRALALDVTPVAVRLTIDEAAPIVLADWAVNGAAITFSYPKDGATVAVRATLEPWGIVGTAADGANAGRILELVRAVASGAPAPSP